MHLQKKKVFSYTIKATYVNAGMRVTSFRVVSLYLIPSEQSWWLQLIKIQRCRVKCLQVSFFLSEAGKNVHFVTCHAGRMSITLLRCDQAGRQIILMRLLRTCSLILAIEIRAYLFLLLCPVDRVLFDIRLCRGQDNPLGVFKFFLRIGLKTCVFKRF